MNLITQTIKNYIISCNINDEDFTYLVAFSGGYDSMCLLHALKQVCKNRIIAIHLNHNWRGEESDIEEQNCKGFCTDYGIEFYSEKLSDSIEKNETTAREERYKFFEKCAVKFGSKIIFTAHNKNDNAETLLYRIAKGTGVKGLMGISCQRGIYYRPLLEIERSDIEQYCKDNNLTPNCDSSNDDNIHKRNLIRNKILPLMSEINPSFITSINRLSKSAVEDNEIVLEYIELIRDKISKNGRYDIKKFMNLSKAVQMRIIYEIVSPLVVQNYDRERFDIIHSFIVENRYSKSGKICSITSGYDLYVSEKYFEIISPQQQSNKVVKVYNCGKYDYNDIHICISECNKSDNKLNIDNKIIYADLSDFDFNFEIRTRHEGDIIQPFGMSGHQKLKKYLNSKKIPNHQKDNLVLLVSGKEVLIVFGVGTSEKIRITKNPTHKIEIKE